MKNILEYIPQKPPFVMVDELLSCNSVSTKTHFKITENCIFVENNKLSEVGLIENIAQTCAARLGYLNENQPVKIGMIGSVDNFELFAMPNCEQEIFTEIIVTTEVLNVIVLSAKISCNNNICATCEMKVVLTDIAIQ
ncbi:MAG: hypothetical protein LBV69_01445 [Bacteroidales bacterium]|jgi:predicted hotdog family 3-hydroxylacyl-ACP dehydratase|nr:hypothetical protein [Bacteroidales bacterium]